MSIFWFETSTVWLVREAKLSASGLVNTPGKTFCTSATRRLLYACAYACTMFRIAASSSAGVGPDGAFVGAGAGGGVVFVAGGGGDGVTTGGGAATLTGAGDCGGAAAGR